MKWEEKFLRSIENTSEKHIDIKELTIGRIISISPLQIMAGELPLLENNLYINADLLEHTREFTILSGTIGGNQTIISNGSIFLKSQLNKNDLVALRKINDKKYLVICKIAGGA